MTSKEIASGAQFVVLTGSRLYGLHTDDSDYDYSGVVVEPPSHCVGLSEFDTHTNKESNTVIHSLRKFVRLLVKGNPTVNELLWAPSRAQVKSCEWSHQLCEMRSKFVTKRMVRSYMHYLHDQRERLEGKRGQMDIKRSKLIEQFGYDTKYAMHIIRLAVMGTQLARNQQLMLPMTTKHRAICGAIRAGRWKKEEVLQLAMNHEKEIERLLKLDNMPEEVDTEFVSEWLADTYVDEWSKQSLRRIFADVDPQTVEGD
jgi:predicted nucleotidyltransferase